MTLISKTGVRNLLAVGGFLLLSTAYVVHDGYTSSGGITGYTNKPTATSTPGCTCHSSDEAPETVVRFSTEATSFEPGKTYRFKLTVTNPSKVAGGVNIAKWLQGTGAATSTFALVQGQGLKSGGSTQLTHTSPKTFVDGGTSWEFDYIAPPIEKGSDTLYATANAVNRNGNDDAGDHWGIAPKFVINLTQSSVSPRTDIAEAFAIGPNPARNNATLYFMMKRPADLRISLVDASGREVSVQHKGDLSFGRGEVMMDLSNLAVGDYLVNVTSGGSLLYTGKISHAR